MASIFIFSNKTPGRLCALLTDSSGVSAGGVPFIALTATATPSVRRDIEDVLKLDRPLVSVESTYKANLFLSREVRPPSQKKLLERIVQLLLLHGTHWF